MTKEELEQVVLGTIDELSSKEMTDSQALLMTGFIDGLRQRSQDQDQSDHFAEELKQRLNAMQ